MACHETLEKPLLRWTCAEHRLASVSCVDCHDPNARRGATLRRKDPDLCLSCHPDTGAEFRLPSRHRLHEGFLTCNDCHDPHANVSSFKDRSLRRDTCVRCHPEKGGPFVFDHAARAIEGCVACHRPHGSTASRLLVTRDVRTLCLSCHPDLPADHEQRPGSVYRDCLRCHVEVHGSDVNRTFHR
jgi:DmsE family decaheme c-type cytochrome